MAKTVAGPILHMIRRLVADQGLKELPDQELLRRFRNGRDEGAFSGLLQRHGSMVLDVCRKILGNEQDAEDAFQATFLVLARKAGAIRKKSSLGSWLYGVAYRTAVNARVRSAKRQLHEHRLPNGPATVPPDDLTWREIQHILHEELNRLSDRYRAPLVHCYLEGRTQHETARQLGLSKTTLQRRLESGRALLRARLLRRGLGPAAVLAASTWPAGTASAVVRPVLLNSTIKAATLIGSGALRPAGLISPKVVALTEGALKAMFLTKLKVASAVVLAVSVCAGLVGWSYQVTAAQTFPQPQQASQDTTEGVAPPAERPAADELEALRLEIDALRKEVRATRERVRALEAEVHGQKEKNKNAAANYGQKGTADPTGVDNKNAAANYGQKETTDPTGVNNKNAAANYGQKETTDPTGVNNKNAASNYSGSGAKFPAASNDSYGGTGAKFPSASKDGYGGTGAKFPSASKDGGAGAKFPAAKDNEANVVPQSRRERSFDYLADAEAALKRLRQNPGDKQAVEALERATQRLKARTKGKRTANTPQGVEQAPPQPVQAQSQGSEGSGSQGGASIPAGRKGSGSQGGASIPAGRKGSSSQGGTSIPAGRKGSGSQGEQASPQERKGAAPEGGQASSQVFSFWVGFLR